MLVALERSGIMLFIIKGGNIMSFVIPEKKGHVTTLTINRPDALNALNSDVLADLSAAIDEVENDQDAYVVIITGAGRSFVAGADISQLVGQGPVDGKKFACDGNDVFLKLENMTKPTIAAVNGFALGGGNEMAMACDIRLASEKAKFGQPEVGLGIIPGFGGTQRLARIVGMSKAMELIFTTRTISAAEAKTIGLVSEVYPPDELMPKAMELAETICGQGQIAVREAKRCVRRGLQMDITSGIAYETETVGMIFGTADKTEGLSAYLEKRKEKHFRNC